MFDNNSIGLGYLVGANLEKARQKRAEHAQELKELHARRAQLIRDGTYDTAFTKAHADVIAEIIRESAQQAEDKPHGRLSDPANSAGRNQFLAERAKVHLLRLGDEGRISLKAVPSEVARWVAKRPLK